MRSAGEIPPLTVVDVASAELRSLVVLPEKKGTLVEFKRADDFRIVCKVTGNDPSNVWHAPCHASVPGHYEKLQGRSLTVTDRLALHQSVKRFLQDVLTPGIKPFLDSVESASEPPNAEQMLGMMKARGQCKPQDQMEAVQTLEQVGALLDPEQCPSVALAMNLGNVPVEIGWTLARDRSEIVRYLGLSDDATVVDAVLTVGGVSIFMIDSPEWWNVTAMAGTPPTPAYDTNFNSGCSMSPLGRRP